MPGRRVPGQYGTFITRRSQILQKIGSCIFLVGVPISIMGIIFTVVAYGSAVRTGHMLTFSVLGPVFISTAIACFLAGFIMIQMTEETLARFYSYFPITDSNNDLCCCLLCMAIRRPGGNNSHRPTDNAGHPRSILHHSSGADHKLMVNRVHFDSQSDDDVTDRERSLSNCSITSLQRHCRVFPSQLSWEDNRGPTDPPLAVVSGNLPDIVTLNSQSNGIDRPVSASHVLPIVDNYSPVDSVL